MRDEATYRPQAPRASRAGRGPTDAPRPAPGAFPTWLALLCAAAALFGCGDDLGLEDLSFPCGPARPCAAAWTCGPGATCVRGSPLRCGGMICPHLDGHEVACNAAGHCEYVPASTTGQLTGSTWIWVPPGRGFTNGDAGVTFALGFFIAKYEATVAQHQACVDDTSYGGCEPLGADLPVSESCGHVLARGWNDIGQHAEHPRNGLRWRDARGLCAWLGGRLPGEDEWSYAAAGDTGRAYPWGMGPEPDAQHAVFGGGGAGGDAEGGTQPVGPGCRAAGASFVGAHDMAGNVWEWTANCGDEPGLAAAGAGSDTSGSCDEGSYYRAPVRGGSFWEAHTGMTCETRDEWPKDSRCADLGVRCARDAPGPQGPAQK